MKVWGCCCTTRARGNFPPSLGRLQQCLCGEANACLCGGLTPYNVEQKCFTAFTQHFWGTARNLHQPRGSSGLSALDQGASESARPSSRRISLYLFLTCSYPSIAYCQDVYTIQGVRSEEWENIPSLLSSCAVFPVKITEALTDLHWLPLELFAYAVCQWEIPSIPQSNCPILSQHGKCLQTVHVHLLWASMFQKLYVNSPL